MGFPFFIGGGDFSSESSSNSTPTPISTSTPTSTPDTIPPSTIIDLSASFGSSRGIIDLSWTAPGDDQSVGTSTEYQRSCQERHGYSTARDR